jgi:energy-coupling factor transporter ATP-binding protein EcfA2
MSLLSVEKISVRYGAHEVLRNVSLAIEPGEIVTIVGPNGSGKTSLLRAIIGAIEPASGTVRRKPGLRIGYVPQRLHIDPTLPITVERFLKLPGGARRDMSDALDAPGVPDLGETADVGAVGRAVPARAAGARADPPPGPAAARRGDAGPRSAGLRRVLPPHRTVRARNRLCGR